MGYTVRRMSPHDLNHAFAWSVRNGWNIGRYDHSVFYATDPQGFFIGEVDGEPVGSVSGVAYDDAFGFVGIYIVRPEFRGMGYGIALFNAAMEYLESRNVGLDGVIEQQDNYRRSGFQLAYRNIRYGGVGGGEVPEGCVPLETIDFATLLCYDDAHFPASRPTFLRGFLSEPDSVALGVVENGQLLGYGVLRPMIVGYSIAPIFADTPAVADLLYRALAAQRPGQPIYLDVPEPNKEAVALANRYRMEPVFETARMYTGSPPELPLHHIYGVTTFELG